MPASNPFIRRPRTEFGKVKAFSLWVPTDEQIEKAERTAAEKGRTFTPSISLRVEVEPYSYRIEGSKLGNVTLKYLDITYGLDKDVIVAAREPGVGLHAVPANRFITAGASGGPDKEDRLFPRWLKHLFAAGFDFSIGEDGVPTSDVIGKVVELQEGEDTFPGSRFDRKTQQWTKYDEAGKPIEYTQRNLQYIVKDASSYVQDPDTVRVIVVRSRDDEEGGESVSSMTGGLDNGSALREAVRATGMVGMNVRDFNTSRKALAFCEANIGVAPILVTDEVSAACTEGKFVDFLVSAKAAIVTDDGVIVGIE